MVIKFDGICLLLIGIVLVQVAVGERVYRRGEEIDGDLKGIEYKGQVQEEEIEIIIEEPEPAPLPSHCKDCFYWTRWLNTDGPGGAGDYETLGPPDRRGKSGSVNAAHPDVCVLPVRMECRVAKTRQPWYTTEDKISVPCLPFQHKGFVCENRKQDNERQCHDYEVRLLCFRECACLKWSAWTDTDHPRDGDGDIEIIGLNRFPTSSNPCAHHMPVGVQCATARGGDIYRSGDRNLICDQRGFACYHRDQGGRRCRKNYHVRFLCPQFG